MVKRIIVRLILEVVSSLGKSAINAYKQTASKQGAKPANPFADFISQTMQAANLAHRPMTKSDAIKILHLEEKPFDAQMVLKNFWQQFHKNDPVKGGSFYIQSMLFNAKNELMKEYPDVDEKAVLAKLTLERAEKEKAEQAAKEEELKAKEEKRTN